MPITDLYDDYGYRADLFDPWMGVPMCEYATQADAHGRVRFFTREC